MKLSGHLLIKTCLVVMASVSAIANAADSGVPTQVLTRLGGSGVSEAHWTRKPDSYDLRLLFPQQFETLDRGGFFIGNAIANLRGLDPAFGTRTLAPGAAPRPVSTIALTDSLIPANVLAYMPTVVASPISDTCLLSGGSVDVKGLRNSNIVVVAPTPAPVPVSAVVQGLRNPDIPVPAPQPRTVQVWLLRPDGTQILPVCQSAGESPKVYRFPLAESAQAVAVAVQVGDKYYIEKLQPLEPTPAQ